MASQVLLLYLCKKLSTCLCKRVKLPIVTRKFCFGCLCLFVYNNNYKTLYKNEMRKKIWSHTIFAMTMIKWIKKDNIYIVYKIWKGLCLREIYWNVSEGIAIVPKPHGS